MSCGMNRMRFLKFLIITILFCLHFSASCSAETIILKSGRTLEGKITEKTDQHVRIDYKGISLTYYWDEIESIEEVGGKINDFMPGHSMVQNQFNSAEPENCTVEIEGETYLLALVKYEPPFISPPSLIASKSQQDLSTPEGTNIAIWSSVGRGREWYLSLHDEKQRQEILESDRKSDGKVLAEVNKGKPLQNPRDKGSYEEFVCKAELEVGSKKYSIIQSRRFVEGEEFPGYTTSTYVYENDSWLRSADLMEHPVKRLIGLKSYEEIKTMCGENQGTLGGWPARRKS